MVAPPGDSPRGSEAGSHNGVGGSGGGKSGKSGRGRGRGSAGASPRGRSPHIDPDILGESARPANKRRKRKGAAQTAPGTAGGGPGGPGGPGGVGGKKRSPGPNFSLASQDVMVVGEPSLMGGEFGEEDERLISRLENAQYDPAAAAAQASATQGPNSGPGPLGPPIGSGNQPMNTGGPPPPGPPSHMGGPAQGMDANFGPSSGGPWSSSNNQGSHSSSGGGGAPNSGSSGGPNIGGGPVGSMSGPPGPAGVGGSPQVSGTNQGPNNAGPLSGQIVPKTEPDIKKSPSNC